MIVDEATLDHSPGATVAREPVGDKDNSVVMLQVVDQYRPTDPRVTQFINGVLGVVGFGLITYVAVSAISDLDGFLTRKNAEDFLVAPALTLALVPFLLGVAWVSRREQENLRQRFRSAPA